MLSNRLRIRILSVFLKRKIIYEVLTMSSLYVESFVGIYWQKEII